MSLINQMLKDLETRRADDVRGRLNREIRPLPRESRWPMRAGAGAAVLLALAVGFGGWRLAGESGEVSSSAVLVAPTAPPLGAAVSAPVAPTSAENPSTAVTVDLASGLKVSSILDRPPVVEEVAPAERETVPPRQARERTRSPSADASMASVEREAKLAKEKSDVLSPARSHAEPARSGSGVIDIRVAQGAARERANAEYQRAVSLLSSGQQGGAVDALLDVLRIDGGHLAGRQLLAKTLLDMKRGDEAMALLAEGLISHPRQVGWAMTLARLQVERGDFVGADKTLHASREFGATPEYLGFHGSILQRLARYRDAAESYRAAARLVPAEGRWWLGLGLAQEADGQGVEAQESFRRARATGSLSADLLAIVEQKLR